MEHFEAIGLVYKTFQDKNFTLKLEINYTTTKKELLAILYSVMKLRTYLIGHRLTFFNLTADLNARLISWSIILQHYDFEVAY